jgi:hypothetical protein
LAEEAMNALEVTVQDSQLGSGQPRRTAPGAQVALWSFHVGA